MDAHQRMMHLDRIIKAALEFSVLIAPKDFGLTADELVQIGGKFDYKPGEIGDRLYHVSEVGRAGRQMPQRSRFFAIFSVAPHPDFRSLDAFDFVISEVREHTREHGQGHANLARDTLVERGVQKGIERNDLEGAVSMLVLAEHFGEKDGRLWQERGASPLLPSEQASQEGAGRVRREPDADRAKIYEHVAAVIGRRSDGRPSSPEPLRAFAEHLDKLGYGRFRQWWLQIVGELRRTADNEYVTRSVLAAALVEGALTFVVKHARAKGLGVLGSKKFEDQPQTWKIDQLVASAAAGLESAILDERTRARAMDLVQQRQRIHAGRMLADYPHPDGVVPDLRPEEARAAQATADAVVRKVCDWLERYPPA